MKEVLTKLGDSAHVESEPMFADPICRWRTHKTLLREASRVVRAKKLLAGAAEAESEGNSELRMLALARAMWPHGGSALRI